MFVIVGDKVESTLPLVGWERTEVDVRLFLHCTILYANKLGAPKGQPLMPINANVQESAPQVDHLEEAPHEDTAVSVSYANIG